MQITTNRKDKKKKFKVSQATYNKLKGLVRAAHDEFGYEVPDPTPCVVDVGQRGQLSLREQIQRCLKQELSDQAMRQGYETFAESMDFDIDEDPFPESPYPVVDMVEEEPVDPAPSPEPNPDDNIPDPEPDPIPDPSPETGSA